MADSYQTEFDNLRERMVVQGALMRAAASDVLSLWRDARAVPGAEKLAADLEQTHRALAWHLARDDEAVFALRKMLNAGDAVRTVGEAVAAAGAGRAA